jgi:hypothetical protein
LNKIASEPGVIKHESGFYYKVNEPGTGKTHPSATSKVTVHYEGTLIDGTVFDSSYQRGETISFGLNQVCSLLSPIITQTASFIDYPAQSTLFHCIHDFFCTFAS